MTTAVASEGPRALEAYDLDALHQAACEAATPASVVGCTTCGAFTDEAQVARVAATHAGT